MNIIPVCKKRRINNALFLAFVLFALSCTASSYAQHLKENDITLKVQDEPVENVFNKISNITNFKFFYDYETVNKAPYVSMDIKGGDLQQILNEITSQSQLYFNRAGNTIAVSSRKTTNNNAQAAGRTKNISGRVYDDKGEPVIGASIMVEGTANGTITGLDGKYMLLNVPDSSTLIISYVGYKTKSFSAKENLSKITLVEDSKLIDEVVVVGYGVQKKRDVTTAISSVRASDLEGQPVTSMAEAMVGKMPGVQVTQGSGAPGSALQIKVRGTGTITAGTSPLYVVDGVPLAKESLSTFNMNDVESIEVLKDASSSAIYGSRGSNGVVLITTKKGKEGKTAVAYNGYYGWQTVSRKIDMLNAYEYAALVKDARNNTYADKMESINRQRAANGQAALSFSINDDNGLRLQNSNDLNSIVPMELNPYLEGKQGLTDTDWQDEIFRTAGIQNHAVSVSGGTPKVKYYASLDYLGQDGIIINSSFNRYSARLNLDVAEGIFQFGIAINPSFVKKNSVQSDGAYNKNGGGIIASALHSSPIFPVYHPDGSFSFAQNSWSADTETVLPGGKTKGGNNQTQVWNPVALAMLQKDETRATRIFGNAYAEVNFLPALEYRANFGVDLYSDAEDIFRPSIIPLSNKAGNPESVPEAKSNTSRLYNYLFEQTINFSKEFNGHSISAFGGWTMQYQRNESNYAFANGFITNNISTLNAGTVTRGDSKASEWALLSGLARIQYSYNGKYMASGAIRADGASRFGKNNRWGIFPSASVGWRLSEESFMKQLAFIDDLKLRASYGLTGNFRIPNYGAQGEIGYYSYVLGGFSPNVVKGAAPKSMPNPDLRWEKTAQFNLGFDASLFKNRLALGLDLYTSNTYDLLLDVPVPMTTGYKTRLENIGKVNNKGIEFNVATTHKLGGLTWEVNFNISKNMNEVKQLGPGNADIIYTGSVSNAYFITRVGEPIGSYYLPVVEGVYKNQAEIDAAGKLAYKDSPTNYGLADAKPGDFKFKDVNGDGILDILDTDRAIVGNYMPEFTYGFGTSLGWRSIDFSITFQGVHGNKILNLSRRYFYNHEGNMNNYKGALNRWKSEGDPGSGMNVRANRVSKGQNGTTSTWHVEDGSYLRVKNIVIGCTLPKAWTKKAFIQTARIYCSMQNPFTFTKYKGYNPEVTNSNDAVKTGEDYGVYPLAKTTSVGVNLTF